MIISTVDKNEIPRFTRNDRKRSNLYHSV